MAEPTDAALRRPLPGERGYSDDGEPKGAARLGDGDGTSALYERARAMGGCEGGGGGAAGETATDGGGVATGNGLPTGDASCMVCKSTAKCRISAEPPPPPTPLLQLPGVGGSVGAGECNGANDAGDGGGSGLAAAAAAAATAAA